MSCDCAEKISQLIDGELPDVEARAMQRHLNECLECQQARADFLSLRTEIGSYLPSLNSASQADALQRIVGRQSKPSSSVTRSKPSWFWSFSPRSLAFAAVILLAAFAGFVVYRAMQQKETRPARIAETPSSPLPVAPQKVESTRSNDDAVATNTPPNSASPAPKPVSQKSRRVHQTQVQSVAVRRVRQEATPHPANGSNNAGDIQALTAIHFEKSELLLRAFRNVRATETGTPAEIAYERNQAQQLIVRNMMLKREADASGDVQVSSLLENLEPILLDIANLPDGADADDIRVINERVERKNMVALLQVNSTMLARALDDD
jgi:anti-sigma factor RsiW